MADRLATKSTPGTQALHVAQRNSEAGNIPHSPTRTYTSSSRIPRPLFPNFLSAPPVTAQQMIAQRQPTQVDDTVEYRREYVALGPDFHQDMTLVDYYGLKVRNRPKDTQRGGQQ